MTDFKSVFILDGLSGHRISWIHEILDLLELSHGVEFWIRKDPTTVNILELRQKDLGRLLKENIKIFDSASEIYDQINESRKTGECNNFTILDGDNWLRFEMLKRNNLKILVMRPYVTESSFLGYLRFSIKKVLILGIFFRSKDKIRCLSITGWSPQVMKSLWLDDDLILPTLFSDILEMN